MSPRCGNLAQGVTRDCEHDHYLKMWALTEPRIEADSLFLDEAQDSNPVLEQVFAAQRAHAHLVMVGDSAQAIYGWRGARDVMARCAGLDLAGAVPCTGGRRRRLPRGQAAGGPVLLPSGTPRTGPQFDLLNSLDRTAGDCQPDWF